MQFPELYFNPDHREWAKEFCRLVREGRFDPANDEEWVASWIANAMMHGDDRATGNYPTMLSDGSAFVVD